MRIVALPATLNGKPRSLAIDKNLHRTVNTPVKTRIRSIFSLLLVAAIFLAIGYVTGLRRGQYQAALEEAKVARASLNRDDITLEPQLREYMKGRIYYLIGTKFYRARSQFGPEWNEGTVDTNILQKPIYAKDPTFAPSSLLKKRHFRAG